MEGSLIALRLKPQKRFANDLRGLFSLDCGSLIVEMDTILIEIGMPGHERVLVVDDDSGRLDRGLCNDVSGFDPGIGRPRLSFGFDRG